MKLNTQKYMQVWITSFIFIVYFFTFSTTHAAPNNQSGKVSVNGIDVYYELHGTGKPIVLIAGFTCDHTFWQGVLAPLTQKHQVLIFDNRGIGQTSTPDAPYTIEMMADDTMLLIKKLGIQKPIVVGQSMGSAIAQNIGKRYGNDIEKLILINTFDYLEKVPEVAFDVAGKLQFTNIDTALKIESLIPWVFSSRFLSQPNQVPTLIKMQESNPYPQTTTGYQRQFVALKAFNSTSYLHDIHTPTLIIAGSDDIIAPLAGAHRVADGIGKGTKIIVLPAGHGTPIEQPQKTAQAILEFADMY